jgi:hypothetical protein
LNLQAGFSPAERQVGIAIDMQVCIAIDIVIVLIDRPEFISDTGVSPEVDDPPVDGLPARAIARDIEHGTLHSCNSAVILAGNDPFC